MTKQDLGNGRANQLRVGQPRRSASSPADTQEPEQIVDLDVECHDEGVEFGLHTPYLGALTFLTVARDRSGTTAGVTIASILSTSATMERLHRLARLKNSFPGRVLVKYVEDDGPNWSTLIAWNALTSVFPITLALAAILGFLLSGSGVTQRMVSNLILQLLPNNLDAQQQALQAVDGAERRSGIFAVLALIGFFWIASNLFGAMEAAFDHVLRCPRRNVLLQKLRALVLMAVFAILACIAVGSSALLPLLESLPNAPRLGHGVAGTLLQFLIGAGSGVLLFSVLYGLVPNTELSVRTILPGAVFAGVAFEVLTLLLPLYLVLNQGINQYGRTFALLFFLLFFFFVLGTITMLGIEIDSVILERSPGEKARGSGLGGAAGAPTP
jgi:membrane protein